VNSSTGGDGRQRALSGVGTRKEFADFGDDIADSDRSAEHSGDSRKRHISVREAIRIVGARLIRL
jgi:hypothetical protein